MKHVNMIDQVFMNTADRHEAALIIYLTGGFPDLEQSMKLVQSCAQSGADIIEIGIPFSDPVADGPTIQYSSQQALAQGITLESIMKAIHELKIDIPIVVMSYLNPILAFGWSRFLDTAMHDNISGLIIPDLPVEEAVDRAADALSKGVHLILLAAPTSTLNRLQQIVDTTNGFIYCVSITGTTGARTFLDKNVHVFLQRIKKMTDKPCAIGFGITTPEHIHSLRESADGVIVGSRIIEGIRNNENIPKLVSIMKKATRR